MTDLSLSVNRTIKAPPKRIYDAWLDPGLLARFMLAGPDVTIAGTSCDPRVGGRFDVMMVIGGKELPHGGVYSELTPHRRIVFQWESPHVAEPTTVTITLAPTDAGTEVVLTHTRFRDAANRDAHEAGWGNILKALDEVLA